MTPTSLNEPSLSPIAVTYPQSFSPRHHPRTPSSLHQQRESDTAAYSQAQLSTDCYPATCDASHIQCYAPDNSYAAPPFGYDSPLLLPSSPYFGSYGVSASAMCPNSDIPINQEDQGQPQTQHHNYSQPQATAPDLAASDPTRVHGLGNRATQAPLTNHGPIFDDRQIQQQQTYAPSQHNAPPQSQQHTTLPLRQPINGQCTPQIKQRQRTRRPPPGPSRRLRSKTVRRTSMTTRAISPRSTIDETSIATKAAQSKTPRPVLDPRAVAALAKVLDARDSMGRHLTWKDKTKLYEELTGESIREATLQMRATRMKAWTAIEVRVCFSVCTP